MLKKMIVKKYNLLLLHTVKNVALIDFAWSNIGMSDFFRRFLRISRSELFFKNILFRAKIQASTLVYPHFRSI
jgi:hypothetical protein